MFILALCGLCVLTVVGGQCPGNVDLAIAVPGDIPDSEFEEFESKLIDLLYYFKIDHENFNVGLIIYGKKAVNVAWPQPLKTRQQTNTRVSILSRRSIHEKEIMGGNDITLGIKAITTMLLEAKPGVTEDLLRPTARKIGIIFQYGKAVDSKAAVKAALVASNEGILLYAVNANGTGREFFMISYDECRGLSEPDFEQGLNVIIPKLGDGICAEANPRVLVSERNCYPKKYSPLEKEVIECGNTVEMLPDPNNCANYVRCVFRKPVTMKCADPTLFNPATGRCDYIREVECYTNTELICPKKNGVFAHPIYCARFLSCFEGTAHAMQCPPYTWFDVGLGVCVFPDSTTCPTGKNGKTQEPESFFKVHLE